MNSKFSKTLLFTVASVLSTDSYVKATTDWYSCIDVPNTIGNFNKADFSNGEWFEVMRDGGTWWQGGESCAVVKYSDWAGWYTD
jgi:hypothetical protein